MFYSFRIILRLIEDIFHAMKSLVGKGAALKMIQNQ